jgi:hypothetical protein
MRPLTPRSRPTRRAIAAALAAVGLVVAGCAGGDTPEHEQETDRTDARVGDAGRIPGADVGPVCRDADGDGRLGCEDDCDDTSPFVRPGARELCNGVDDDCDGTIDEGYPQLGDACTAGTGVCEATGRVVCAANAIDVRCDAVAGPGSPETCDREDEDCDGTVDEGAPACCRSGEQVPCGVDVGACEMGLTTCDANGVFGECEGGRGPAEVELCNGIDDDCNGLIDDAVPTVGEDCETGAAGPCGPGTWRCEARELECIPIATPAAEVCNGVDDDCDGEADEGTRNACGDCGALPTETCNGSDDDCDGLVDEGTAVADHVCTTPRGRFDARIEGGRAGLSVAIIADQNGDGFVDVLVGAPGPPSPSDVGGALYVVSGRDGRRLAQHDGAPTDGEFGAALAVADVDGDGRDEWLVGIPDAVTDGGQHRGRVAVLEAGTFRERLSMVGNVPSGRFGASVSAGQDTPGGPPVIVVGQPAHNSQRGRAACYDVETDPQTGALSHLPRWQVLGQTALETLGSGVALGPPDDFGRREVLYVHGDDGSPQDDEIVVASSQDGMTISRIEAPSPSQRTFGTTLGVHPEYGVFAVGAWSALGGANARGAAWLLWPDGEIVDSVEGLAAGDHLGVSTVVGETLRADAELTWCAGALTSALDAAPMQPRPGYVLCRTELGAPVVSLGGASPSDEFGRSLALADTDDPDGGRLLVVGAPAEGGIAARAGSVYLFRLVRE